jgi:pimeloyl-ACP methyl ester carboxylesterase
MSAPRWLLSLACGLALAGIARAQTPSEIRVLHRDGQTFVTWREIPGPAKRAYRVYRDARRIETNADLDGADFLGEVDDRSSRNQGRSLATGVEWGWILPGGGAPLAADQGLFVHTVERDANRVHYAVTSVLAGNEERTLLSGVNATSSATFERVAPPQPVLQASAGGLELFAHWVGDRDTPRLPALSPWPSRGFNFVLQRGTASGARGLVLALHAAGQTYSQAWPQRFELPLDVDLLQLSDLNPYTSFDLWFGTQEDLPGPAGPGTRVWNYTQQRIAWTLDWVAAHLGAAHDPERVYVVGGSMGAIGGMYLVSEYPERFAAALLRNGLYDLRVDDYRNPALFALILGDLALGLATRAGIPILQRTDASFMAARDPATSWPVIRTINGRNDEVVGWSSAVGLYAGLARAKRAAVHYFDERQHSPDGYWRGLERALLARTCKTRRDRPSLRFDGCTLDDDPGDGTRADGDPVGTINAYLEYDPETARGSASELEFELCLRAKGALDDAPAARARARLTPCRTGAFAPAPDEAVLYSLRDGGVLVDEHLLFADAFGRLQTPPAPLARAPRVARFQRGTPEAVAPLFLGDAPLAGQALQAVVRGAPGEPWVLVLTLRAAGALSGGSLLLSGNVGAAGRSELAVPIPRAVPDGALLRGHARIADRASGNVTVRVQSRWRSHLGSGAPP